MTLEYVKYVYNTKAAPETPLITALISHNAEKIHVDTTSAFGYI